MVRGLYDFSAEEEGELGFRKGDVIEIIEKEDANWWRGRLNGKEGTIPQNYVQEIA